MLRGALFACVAALCSTGTLACEAVTDGFGLPGRFVEAEFTNTKARSGQHENWAPRTARLIMHAGFDTLTSEYDHRILGAAQDTKVLTIHVRQPGDDRITCPAGVVLPKGQVFEDIAPRLADLDGDGRPEVIVVQTDVTKGAKLAVYDRRGRLVTATPNIGRTHRWLAPIGAADLDGDGHMEIAYVDRPHLARLLRVWRFKNGKLELVAEQAGLTNHRIGQNFISGGVRECGQGPELITANADWSRIMSTRFTGVALSTRDIGPHQGQSSFKAALACK